MDVRRTEELSLVRKHCSRLLFLLRVSHQRYRLRKKVSLQQITQNNLPQIFLWKKLCLHQVIIDPVSILFLSLLIHNYVNFFPTKSYPHWILAGRSLSTDRCKMAPKEPFFLLGFLLLFCFLMSFSNANCPKTNSSLLNYTSQFLMVQHQFRGVLTILDDCSFKVSQFDMLQGSDNVSWWGASGETFENLTRGFLISDHKLNQTYKNDSFTVNLLKNVTWDQIKVLSVWDLPTASDWSSVQCSLGL